jgi:hypothetical protein
MSIPICRAHTSERFSRLLEAKRRRCQNSTEYRAENIARDMCASIQHIEMLSAVLQSLSRVALAQPRSFPCSLRGAQAIQLGDPLVGRGRSRRFEMDVLCHLLADSQEVQSPGR